MQTRFDWACSWTVYVKRTFMVEVLECKHASAATCLSSQQAWYCEKNVLITWYLRVKKLHWRVRLSDRFPSFNHFMVCETLHFHLYFLCGVILWLNKVISSNLYLVKLGTETAYDLLLLLLQLFMALPYLYNKNNMRNCIVI